MRPDFSNSRASFRDASVQHNHKAENEQIKTPQDWPEAKGRQKDTEARFTKKRKKTLFGYKNRANVDVQHKLIRDHEVTDASVHDSQVFEELC
ncbi:MAG: transposase [Planctomycetes bacterium]|nr:transposase [Planctomycetota bacterium]